jgi:hypothetical protein
MTLTTLPVALKPAVEKAAKKICQEKCAFMGEPPCWDGPFMDEEFPPPACSEPGCLAEAEAACLAFLNAAIEAGEARKGRGWDHSGSGYWAATTSGASMLPNDFIALILRMGDKT